MAERAQPQSEIHRSSRDPSVLRERLQSWLASTSPGAEVSDVRTTSATGMSSDTILFEAGPEALVARFAPATSDVPVFPAYDLARQAETIRLVGELTPVPVPRIRHSEAEFFVMERVEGEVPPDVLPYTFGDNWLYDAAPGDRRRLQDASVALLAELHAADAERFGFLDFAEAGATPLQRHLAHTGAWYEHATGGVVRSPLIERALAWLEERLPGNHTAVACWGDARIGNVMYRDFEPVAVLDWEMACLGPRELDVAWMIYSHRAFEDLAATFELPGLPDFMCRDDVAGLYGSATGHELRDLDWYIAYSAVQWAIVFLVTGRRAVAFGEREMPSDPEELLYNRGPLEGLIG